MIARGVSDVSTLQYSSHTPFLAIGWGVPIAFFTYAKLKRIQYSLQLNLGLSVNCIVMTVTVW